MDQVYNQGARGSINRGRRQVFKITISSVTVLFSKFFGAADKDNVLAAIPADSQRVVFIDTPSTPVLAETIKALVEQGKEVFVRDHHRGEGRNPEAAEAVEALLGERAKIVTRKEAPACASLLALGEFNLWVEATSPEDGYCPEAPHQHPAPQTVIVADSDLDGLTGAMKALGAVYDGIDADAVVFDERPRQSATTLTALGWTAVRGLATLPPFNPEKPQFSEDAKAKYFDTFVKAASGDTVARAGLEGAVATYEAGVAEAQRLLASAISQPCPCVLLVDTVGAKRSDLTTLSHGMEKRGAKVTVVRKGEGPIAKEHGGVQISLAVAQSAQKEIDLRTFVPEGTPTGLPAGLLSNVAFLLHCSEKVWESTILPALKARFGG